MVQKNLGVVATRYQEANTTLYKQMDRWNSKNVEVTWRKMAQDRKEWWILGEAFILQWTEYGITFLNIIFLNYFLQNITITLVH